MRKSVFSVVVMDMQNPIVSIIMQVPSTNRTNVHLGRTEKAIVEIKGAL